MYNESFTISLTPEYPAMKGPTMMNEKPNTASDSSTATDSYNRSSISSFSNVSENCMNHESFADSQTSEYPEKIGTILVIEDATMVFEKLNYKATDDCTAAESDDRSSISSISNASESRANNETFSPSPTSVDSTIVNEMPCAPLDASTATDCDNRSSISSVSIVSGSRMNLDCPEMKGITMINENPNIASDVSIATDSDNRSSISSISNVSESHSMDPSTSSAVLRFEQVDFRTKRPSPVETKSDAPKIHETKNNAPKIHGTKNHVSETHGSKNHASKTHGTKSNGAKPFPVASAAAKSVAKGLDPDAAHSAVTNWIRGGELPTLAQVVVHSRTHGSQLPSNIAASKSNGLKDRHSAQTAYTRTTATTSTGTGNSQKLKHELQAHSRLTTYSTTRRVPVYRPPIVHEDGKSVTNPIPPDYALLGDRPRRKEVERPAMVCVGLLVGQSAVVKFKGDSYQTISEGDGNTYSNRHSANYGKVDRRRKRAMKKEIQQLAKPRERPVMEDADPDFFPSRKLKCAVQAEWDDLVELAKLLWNGPEKRARLKRNAVGCLT